MTNTPNPALYILMRTDLDSMNAGKGMAQAAHAANAFVAELGDNPADNVPGYYHWVNATEQSFGTTIVVAVQSEHEMKSIVGAASKAGYPAGVVHDPTYPVQDGRVTHLLPIDTCGYIFCPDHAVLTFKPVLKLPLHP